MLLRIALCATMVLLSACVRHSKPITAPPLKPIDRSAYVDLIPGCRLRVVTPLFSSRAAGQAFRASLGKHSVGAESSSKSSSGSTTTLHAPPGFVKRNRIVHGHGGGSTITLHAPPGFVGYETAYYLLKARSNRLGSKIAFQYATITREGAVTRETRPRSQLFPVPRNIRFFRLAFLIRKSSSDHNMALLGTHRKDALNAWTAAILAHPEACRNLKGRSCMWIPAGIAVRPEIKKSGRWEPLR
jgi:hypothetical protein